MLKWLKRLFSKKIRVVINNNYTEDLHSIKNNKAIVGKPITIVIKPLDGFVLDFVRVYRRKISDLTEIECTIDINNISIIKYTPVKEDEKIIVQASARMISPSDIIEQPAIYEIRCDEFQKELPKHGGVMYINPYVIKNEFTSEGRIESIIDYNPETFSINIDCDKINSGEWILEGNKLMASHNDGERVTGELTIEYEGKTESNQIYQE